MKKASITFTVLAFVFAALAVIAIIATPQLRDPRYLQEYLPYVLLIVIGFYTVFGLIAHILANKYRANNGGGLLAVYILTFPAYLVPFAVLLALWAIIKFIDLMLDLFTDGKCSVASIANFLFTAAFGKPKNKTSASTEIYEVIENGFTRQLRFTEQKQDHDPNSPLYTQYYNRFRDDTGSYWRSYDNNQTFIKESYKQTSQGY